MNRHIPAPQRVLFAWLDIFARTLFVAIA